MAGPYTLRALEGLSRSIPDAINDSSRNTLQAAGLMRQIRRDEEMKPTRDVQIAQANKSLEDIRRQNEFLDSPFDTRSLMEQGDTASALHWAASDIPGNVAKTIGGTHDLEGRRIVLQDGKVLTNRQAYSDPRFAIPIKAATISMIDPTESMMSQASRIDAQLAQETDPAKVKYLQTQKAGIAAKMSDPAQMRQIYDRQAKMMSMFADGWKQRGGDPTAFVNGYNRATAAIAKIDKDVELKRKEDFELKKLDITERGANARAAMPGAEQKLLQAIGDNPKLMATLERVEGVKKAKTDTKGTFQKDAEFLSSINGIPLSEAADMIRNDKTLSERLRAYAADKELLPFAMAGATPEEMAKATKALEQKYQLFGAGKAGPTQQRAVMRTGTHNGRKVVQYDDGAIEYAD